MATSAGSGSQCASEISATPRVFRSRRPCSSSSVAAFASREVLHGGTYLPNLPKPMRRSGARATTRAIRAHAGAGIDDADVDAVHVHGGEEFVGSILRRSEGTV